MKVLQHLRNDNLKRLFLMALGTHAKNGLRIHDTLPEVGQEQDGEYHYNTTASFHEGNIYEEWRMKGKRHRSHGPALVIYDAHSREVIGEHYYQYGKSHRIDGPASRDIYSDRVVEEYYIEGELHREDGPAQIECNPNTNEIIEELYFLNGVQVRPEDLLPVSKLER